MLIRHKSYKTLLIAVPVISAILSLNGMMLFRSGVAASCILILCIAYGKNIKKDIWIFIAALLFSITGDWFLSHRNGIPIRFIYGIIFFFIAHLGFLWVSLINGKINKLLLVISLLAYLVFFFLALAPNINNNALLVAVLGYLLISCASFAAAAGVRFPGYIKWSFFAGITSLVFSDTIIAFREFVGYNELDFLIMPTYYLAHILTTFALLANAPKRQIQ